jgi:hypothetical protein
MAADGDIAEIKGNTSTHLLDLARLAEAAERYSDMALRMKELVEGKILNIEKKVEKKKEKELNVEERNLFSVAYKNVIGSVRSSWRTITSGQFNEVDEKALKLYKDSIENKMRVICKEVLDLLGGEKDGTTIGLLNAWAEDEDETKDSEARIFYMKMRGDYYRYLSEFDDKAEYKEGAKDAYTSAMKIAKASLPETHPTRLGLALNFSVCYYEILKKPEKACELAKEAFDAAIEKLDTLNDASYKDSTLIMQLLRDNLTLWTSEAEPAEDNP